MVLRFRFVSRMVCYREVTVNAERHLHRVKGASAAHAATPMRSLGVHEDLGWDTARTSDTNWPKGCSVSCCTVSNKSWGKKAEGNSELCCLSSPVNVVCGRALTYW